MSDSPSQADEQAPYDELIDLRALWRAVRSGWRLVLTVALVSLVLMLIFLHLSKPVYEASLVISPAPDPNGMQSSSLLQRSGLAALAGSRLSDSEEVPNLTLFTQLLMSTDVAERLQAKYNLLPVIFSDRWDAKTRQWIFPSGPLATFKGLIKATLGMQPSRAPTAEDFATFLSNAITIGEISKTGLRRVALRFQDPNMALALLTLAVKEADAQIRENEQARTRTYIAFLQVQLQSTMLTEHREVLTEMLAQQERMHMLSGVDLPFSIKIVEPARVSTDPVSPNPPLDLVLATVWGVIFGYVVVLARFFLFGARAPDEHWWMHFRRFARGLATRSSRRPATPLGNGRL